MLQTTDEALGVVQQLDNVSFFKVGLQLFIAGEMPRLLRSLRGRKVFVDLKVPADIANTLAAVINLCVDHDVKFLTVSESMPQTGHRGHEGRSRGQKQRRSQTAHGSLPVEPRRERSWGRGRW